MLKGGIGLSLMMGPMVPVPVSKSIVNALSDVTIRTAAGQPSGFQMTFSFSSKSPLNTLLLLLAQVGPIIRVILTVTVKGIPRVLMDGVIGQHQVSPNVETGQSVLTVSGMDLSAVMGLIEFTGFPFPCMPAEARVALIIAKYAAFGMIPLVIPSIFMDIPIPVERIPSQQGTDLEYINNLAKEVGYVFYIESGPAPGANIAYWGPEIKVGVPQPALNVNMDAHNNVEALNFSLNGAEKKTPVVYIHNKESGLTIPIPIPSINPLAPPLGLVTPISLRFENVLKAAKLNPVQAVARGVAEAGETTDVVTGSGSLDVLRYGHVLKARGLVGVRGAGDAFNGLYFVKSVTHRIKRGQYKQDFELTRNGLISTLPAVPA